jgi:ABC-2 type transport system permease protein
MSTGAWAAAAVAGRQRRERKPRVLAGFSAIVRRELWSYFRQPAGWIIIALCTLLMGVVFAIGVLLPNQPASLRTLFDASGWLLLPLAPAITMRLLSDEYRSGTIEPLLASPVGTPALVLGKFVGSVLFLVCMLVPTLVFPATLALFSSPALDVGPIVTGYLALLLLGGLYLSLGLLASACTSNATLAFMLTLFVLLGWLLLPAAARLGEWARVLTFKASLAPRVADFAKGVIDLGHVVFFLSCIACVLACTIAVVRLRRWK